MFKLPELRRLFRLPTRRGPDIAGEIDAEVRFHLEMRVAELRALGLSDLDARVEAVRRFGDVGLAHHALHSADRSHERRRRRRERFGDLRRDILVAVRGFRRSPVFAATAVFMLALGIGATSAVFTVLDRLIFHPLPYPNADRLALVWQSVTGTGGVEMTITPNRRVADAWRSRARSFERIELFRGERATVRDQVGLEPIQADRISAGLPALLGARVILGRPLAGADCEAGAAPVALLSEGLWRRRYGGRPDVLGHTVEIDGRRTTIVGVMDGRVDLTPFRDEQRPAVWLPLVRGSEEDAVNVVALLRPGISAAEAAVELGNVDRQSSQDEHRSAVDLRTQVVMGSDLLGKERRDTFWLLFGAVGLVLLIACANVANLLLVRARVRERELALRSALGAGRTRVARQLMTESVLLGAGGVVLGLVLAWWGLRAIVALRPPELVRLDGLHLTGFTVAFAAGLALLTVMLFGLAPIWAALRADPGVVLIGTGRHPAAGRLGKRLRGGLVIGELAVSLVLLTGAALLTRSFLRARHLPLGFEAEGLGAVTVELPKDRFSTPLARQTATEEIVRRVRAIPRVASLTVSSGTPLSFGVSFSGFVVGDDPIPLKEKQTFVVYNPIRPDYFAVTGVRLIAGRTLNPDTAAREILVNESTARRLWHGKRALGSRVRFSARDPGSVVVGITADVRTMFGDLTEAPFVYGPHSTADGQSTLLIRARVSVGSVLREAAEATLSAAPGAKIRSMQTMDAELAQMLSSDRFTTALLSIVAGIAAVLAAVGLYGVIAYTVTERTYEIGVRMALGADGSSVARLVLIDSARLVSLGLLLGTIASLLLNRLIRSQLYQMDPWDPLALTWSAALFALVAALATLVPARRAVRVDPLLALKSD